MIVLLFFFYFFSFIFNKNIIFLELLKIPTSTHQLTIVALTTFHLFYNFIHRPQKLSTDLPPHTSFTLNIPCRCRRFREFLSLSQLPLTYWIILSTYFPNQFLYFVLFYSIGYFALVIHIWEWDNEDNVVIFVLVYYCYHRLY